ncbi:hypothetical protein [Hyphomicrobium sp.]|uniref:hypothetical protein n=1 Tax=Hyphomicrobium sp. TaxID=82 RepID=UPI001D94F4DE|nr:hypothetical protein [Hyphomicrobium sp.]MBY0562461.1 hypothetical protein [Hyphomicrobium sp.]
MTDITMSTRGMVLAESWVAGNRAYVLRETKARPELFPVVAAALRRMSMEPGLWAGPKEALTIGSADAFVQAYNAAQSPSGRAA